MSNARTVIPGHPVTYHGGTTPVMTRPPGAEFKDAKRAVRAVLAAAGYDPDQLGDRVIGELVHAVAAAFDILIVRTSPKRDGE